MISHLDSFNDTCSNGPYFTDYLPAGSVTTRSQPWYPDPDKSSNAYLYALREEYQIQCLKTEDLFYQWSDSIGTLWEEIMYARYERAWTERDALGNECLKLESYIYG